MEEEAVFTQDGVTHGLSNLLVQESLQHSAIDGWLLIYRTKFDVYKSSEPYRIMELLFELRTGRVLFRVWHMTVYNGRVSTMDELCNVIKDAFHGTVPCAGVTPNSYDPDEVEVTLVPFDRVYSKQCQLRVRPTDEQRASGGVMRCESCKQATNPDVSMEGTSSAVAPGEMPVKVEVTVGGSDGEEYPLEEDIEAAFDDDSTMFDQLPLESKMEIPKFDEEGQDEDEDDDDEEEDEEYVGKKPKKKKQQRYTPRRIVTECRYCDLKVGGKVTASNINQHEKVEHLAGVVYCRYCAESFKTIFLLVEHSQVDHPEVKEVDCLHCNKMVALEPKEDFSKHFQACVTKSFTDPKYRRSRQHLEEIKCRLCDKKCRTWVLLRGHYRMHRGTQDLECDECDFKTYSKYSLDGHKQLHKRVRGETAISLICDLCGKNFNHAYSLRHHVKYVHGDKKDDITCEKCGKHFNRQKSYRSHYLKAHSGDSRFECKICQKRFTLMVKAEWCEKMHNGIFPYNCTVCGKGMGEKRNFDDHMRIHTGERPFPCSACSYTGKSKSALFIHKRSVHKGLLQEEAEKRRKAKEESMGHMPKAETAGTELRQDDLQSPNKML